MSDDAMFGWLKGKLDKAKSISPPPDPPPSPPESLPIPTIADVLTLPDVERKLINWLVRQQKATLGEIAAFVSQDEASTQTILDGLVQKGFVSCNAQSEPSCYEPRLRSRRSS